MRMIFDTPCQVDQIMTASCGTKLIPNDLTSVLLYLGEDCFLCKRN